MREAVQFEVGLKNFLNGWSVWVAMVEKVYI